MWKPRTRASRPPARPHTMDGRLNWMKTVHHIGCEIGLDENLHTNGWEIEVDESSNFLFYSIFTIIRSGFSLIFLFNMKELVFLKLIISVIR
jgi:hypothetical protein